MFTAVEIPKEKKEAEKNYTIEKEAIHFRSSNKFGANP
jgi:hypothetical protein